MRYGSAESINRFCLTVVDHLQKLSGDGTVAIASALPLTGINNRTDFMVMARPPLKTEDTPAGQHRWITSRYFEVMGIPLRAGRYFQPFDRGRSERVAIVDEALAHRFMAGLNPVDQHLVIDFGDGRAP